ncbi:MAG: hypothetical protein V2A56_04610 [bacterium]
MENKNEMAGFDFTFRCDDVDRELGRALLLRVQRIARNQHLSLQYKINTEGWYVKVDGSLPTMQVLLYTISLQLMPFGEGFSHPKSLNRRRRVVLRLIDNYCEGLQGIRNNIEKIAEVLAGTPNSFFFNEGVATHLSAQVRDAELSLILFYNGMISASLLAEDIHTLADALLKACLPKKDRDRPFSARLFDVADLANLNPKQVQVLTRLKTRRRNAKHGNQRVKHVDMDADMSEFVSTLQKLFAYLRRSKD